jgi:acyl-CoA synthetase (NDP forming)
MVCALRAAPLLQGYRGQPPRDVDALAEAIWIVGHALAREQGRVREIDLNPVFVGVKGEGVVAADALIVLHGAGAAAQH